MVVFWLLFLHVLRHPLPVSFIFINLSNKNINMLHKDNKPLQIVYTLRNLDEGKVCKFQQILYHLNNGNISKANNEKFHHSNMVTDKLWQFPSSSCPKPSASHCQNSLSSLTYQINILTCCTYIYKPLQISIFTFLYM